MAIIRCTKCAHLAERADAEIGLLLACPRCGNPTQVYPTLFFVSRLLEKYFAAQHEVTRLTATGGSGTATAAPPADATALPVAVDRTAGSEQNPPIAEWFGHRQVSVQIADHTVDTSGFFDEVALLIGRNLPLVKVVLDRIRWAQKKGHASTVIPLHGKSPADAQRLGNFCQQLYDYSFVTRAIANRQKNNVLLAIQTAPTIRHFFNGEWLEWFALMSCLQRATERGKRFSCARNVRLTLADGEQLEIDVFVLIDGQLPIVIECRSGEYRQDIDSHVALRTRLGLSGNNLIFCVAGLEDEMARGLSAMYDLSFVSERGLSQHLARLL
ncbi:MAG: hypothetical protein AW08_03008 [Candidatus Accumulibacter adjunctus]|uniref:DUF1887 family protein n=1 Tax=Candidatus Accumulibacter adjunctus TaxID=1454001 RepID=A0A011NLX0_9PROT|nr:MAG: hypothetical protein AW08_03008 [Candidatus Accumulibacter adjunctus]